jgi:ATP-binding cassette subfamily B multidrug efflux pump
MTLFQLIGSFVRQHWRAYLSSGFMLAGVATLSVLIPRRVGALVDGLAGHRLSNSALLQELGILIVIGVMIYFLRVAWRLRLFAASYQLGVDLRRRYYARLCLHGPGFYQKQRTGDLMALATNDIDAIELAAGEAMLAGFDGSLSLLLTIAVMTLGIDWRLAAVALLPFPFMAFAFWRISGHIHRASSESLSRFSDLNGHVQETLAGVRTLRALGLEQRSAKQFSQLAEQAAAASLRAQCWEAAFEPTVGLTLTTAGTLTLAMGGYLVWQGEITIGGLTSFSIYLGHLIWPMFAAGWVLALIERARAAFERIGPILDAPEDIDDHGTIAQLAPGQLSLQAITYRYPGQTQDALCDIALKLAPGQTLGIVGPTGAGKSTLLRLLLRQYHAQSGSLTWGGHALDDYRLDTLRAAISWVPQESFLFSASIAENIALARPNASRAEIEHVADLAAIHDDIKRFAQAYETHVGERGITLSGGQRQRVAIARALLADSPLLLLDDALSAVDTGTETNILAHLAELRLENPSRSVIIASHRLSAVVDADQIIVLHEGRIIERGSHETLLALDGWYASQWRYQQLEASLDAL